MSNLPEHGAIKAAVSHVILSIIVLSIEDEDGVETSGISFLRSIDAGEEPALGDHSAGLHN